MQREINQFWQKGEQHLANADEKLILLIDKFGPCTLKPLQSEDYYTFLLKDIISQQSTPELLNKSWQKLTCVFGHTPQPKAVLAAADDYFESFDIPQRKMHYIRDLSDKIVKKILVPEVLNKSSEARIIQDISQVLGLGRWTAERFMINAMCRPDIFPGDDGKVQYAMRALYSLADVPKNRSEMRFYSEKWRPWRSLATWYLWQYFESMQKP